MSPLLVAAPTATPSPTTYALPGITAQTLYYKGTFQASSNSVTATNLNYWHAGSGSTVLIDDVGEWDSEGSRVLYERGGALEIPVEDRAYRLPDGSVLHVDAKGNFRVDDAQAQVVYQANRIKDFNPYVNASDQLARFIDYAGRLGVRRSEIATLPLGLFVNWLITEAAGADGDPVPVEVTPVAKHKLLKATVHPRCPACRRFVPRRAFAYCNDGCAERHWRKCA